VLASSAFALWTVLTKVAFRHGATVTALVVSRFIIGAAFMLVLCRALRLPLWDDRRLTLRLMGLGTTFVLSAAFLNLAIARIPAGTTSLLLYTYPAFVTGLDVALGRERWSRLKGVVLAVSVAGTVLVLGTPNGAMDAAGVLFALGGAFVLGVNMILIDEVATGVHPFAATARMMLGGALVSSAYALVPGSTDLHMPAAAWGMLVLLAVLSTVIAFTAKVMSIDRLGATRASLAATIEPVAAVVLAAIILSERLGPGQLVGGAMVITAVAAIPLIRSSAVGPLGGT
jgi:drug/metabolite transporter (DMT)-like permease